jgi:CHAT domain-containing protein
VSLCAALHLATHGYFSPPNIASALEPPQTASLGVSWLVLGRDDVAGLHPGLLSGLVCAGANAPPRDPATGMIDVGASVLTAEEVAGLDLNGCRLAVLSACETGLANVAGGQGVLGLQRAFHRAGAGAVMASLWIVDDAATSLMMEDFYAHLWGEKLTPMEALRRAQRTILDHPEKEI